MCHTWIDNDLNKLHVIFKMYQYNEVKNQCTNKGTYGANFRLPASCSGISESLYCFALRSVNFPVLNFLCFMKSS